MEKQRLDKWLWCARLYKTRALAHEEITKGRIQIGGLRAKPSKSVSVGDQLTIHKPPYVYEIDIIGLSKQRLPANKVSELYVEFADSIERRQSLSEQLKSSRIIEHSRFAKLNKKERRERGKLKRGM